MIANSLHFAIYSKILELADRWNIKPYQFDARVSMEPGADDANITYISCYPEVSEQFNKMLTSLCFGGILSEGPVAEYNGFTPDLLKKIDKALEVAPTGKFPGVQR